MYCHRPAPGLERARDDSWSPRKFASLKRAGRGERVEGRGERGEVKGEETTGERIENLGPGFGKVVQVSERNRL